MTRALSTSLVFLLLVAPVAPADAQSPDPRSAHHPAISAAAARAVARETVTGSRVGYTRPRQGPPGRRRPAPRRAVVTGALIGAVLGGVVMAAQYREGGAEAAWFGVYTGGFAGAVVGWRVSR